METKLKPSIQGTLDAATNFITQWLETAHGPNIKINQSLNVVQDYWTLRWHIPELILTEDEVDLFEEADLDNSYETPLEPIALAKGNLLAIDGNLHVTSTAVQGTFLDIKLDRRSVYEKIEDELNTGIAGAPNSAFIIEKDLKWLIALVVVVIVAGSIVSVFLH